MDEFRGGQLPGVNVSNRPTQRNGFDVAVTIQADLPKFFTNPTKSPSIDDEGAGNPAETWAYVCAHLGKDYPLPTGEGARTLLRLPPVRPLQLSPSITTPLSDRQIMGVLIYMTGVEWDAPCTNCRRNPPPFHGCVRLVADMIDDPHVADTLRSLRRSCANCIFGSVGHTCSIKSTKTWESHAQGAGGASVTPSLPRGRVDEGSDADEEDEVPTRNLRKRRRRSPSPSEEPPLKRKVVTMKVHPNRLGNATASGATGAETSRARHQTSGMVLPEPREDVLEMEDWELEQGHIAPANASNSTSRMSPPVTLLSSTSTNKRATSDLATHVSIGQTIRLSKDVTVSIDTISAGAAFQFPPHSKQTRVCTMIGGKLKVQVDGEEEFTIGSRSMFRVGPGAKCLVVNGFYVDAVVHVTTLTE